MKRLFCYSIAIMLIVSCAHTTPEEMADPFLEEGMYLSGLDAAEVYSKGLEEAETPSLYYNLAYSYLEAGEYGLAVSTADEALSLFPDYLRFRYLRAYALRSSMKYYSYERELREILEIDPGNDGIREMLLEHYMATGRKADAVSVARKIIQYDPDNPEALRALAYSSAFFAAIAPEEESEEKEKTRLWTEPPFIYMPIGILNGDRLLSGSIDTEIEEEVSPDDTSETTELAAEESDAENGTEASGTEAEETAEAEEI